MLCPLLSLLAEVQDALQDQARAWSTYVSLQGTIPLLPAQLAWRREGRWWGSSGVQTLAGQCWEG